MTVVCAAAGCSFSVSLRARDDDVAEITTSSLVHSCAGNEHRKHELPFTLLREIVPGLDALCGQGKRGDGKQVRFCHLTSVQLLHGRRYKSLSNA